jgi:cob(I)alamin adenosyltransferase
MATILRRNMSKLDKGYIHVYTGNGKGKTTAAFGLALRAAGNNMRVFIAQFVKGMKYSEINSLEKLKENITVKQFGRGCFIKTRPGIKDMSCAKKGYEEIKKIVRSGDYDVVILDEINIALYFKLLSLSDVLDLMQEKALHVELILTGRKAEKEIIEQADLVTEMKEVKHYYTKGVLARDGIER